MSWLDKLLPPKIQQTDPSTRKGGLGPQSAPRALGAVAVRRRSRTRAAREASYTKVAVVSLETVSAWSTYYLL